jgi:hypothetical protein
MLVLFALKYLLPLTIMVTLYAKMFVIVRSRFRTFEQEFGYSENTQVSLCEQKDPMLTYRPESDQNHVNPSRIPMRLSLRKRSPFYPINKSYSIDYSVIYVHVIKTELKIAKYIILVMLFICLTRMPDAFVVLFAQFGNNTTFYYLTPYIGSLSILFSKISIVFDPIMFTLKNRKFIVCLKQVLLRKKLSLRSSLLSKPSIHKWVDEKEHLDSKIPQFQLFC